VKHRNAKLMGGLFAATVAFAATVGPAYAAYSPTPRPSGTANGVVYAITVAGDRVYVGGAFTRVTDPATGTTVARSHVAAFDTSTGGLVPDFAPSTDGVVRAIAVSSDGSQVFVGGNFTSVNGSPNTNLAATDRSGALLPGWNASTDDTVKDLLPVGDSVYVAGVFGKVDGKKHLGLGKISAATGAVDPTWSPTATGGRPRALYPTPDGVDLLVAGAFTTINGNPRPFLASLDLATGADTGWSPTPVCSNCDAFDVVTDGTTVYAGVGGGSGGRVAAWSATASDKPLWIDRGDGNVQAIALRDGVLYAGGHFGPSFANATRHQLAAVDPTTGALLPWNPSLGGNDYPGVWAISAGPDFLRVGGGFTTVGGVAQTRYAEFAYQ